ncbi:hypothetical protein TWF694_002704 [Orbilia ellipsospora]|uniref:Uncharacterized protein n=1 Tax=Orbilia ellipsospora TaxID=2528407 RepID=A0AAV9X2T9_9PEZI
MFVEYCYFGTYFSGKDEEANPLVFHAKVYALAERLQCTSLKSVALKNATNWFHGEQMGKSNKNLEEIIPSVLGAISVIYTHTPDISYEAQTYSDSAVHNR